MNVAFRTLPDPVAVLVLNLFTGGYGYFSLGQRAKGIAAIALWASMIYFTCGVASGLLAVVTATDAYLLAVGIRRGFQIQPWTTLPRYHEA